MATLQQVGTEILSNNPSKFYIFCGSEYGIKDRYLLQLGKFYKNNIVNLDSVSQLFNKFKNRPLVPFTPSLYIIRYDSEFLKTLDSNTTSKISALNIVGTAVCIYEDAKAEAKCEKWLSQYTVRIDPISPEYIKKYISQEFPKLSSDLVNTIVSIYSSYNQARMAAAILNEEKFSKLSEDKIKSTFKDLTNSEDVMLKRAVAAKNYQYLVTAIDTIDGELDNVFYDILSCMLELEKLKCNKYANSELRSCADMWTVPDIYYMFEHTYNCLKQVRSGVISNKTNALLYLFSLLVFTHVPEVGVFG